MMHDWQVVRNLKQGFQHRWDRLLLLERVKQYLWARMFLPINIVLAVLIADTIDVFSEYI